MKSASLLQMNDWGIRRFLLVVLLLQAALWAMAALELAGTGVPVLRQVVAMVLILLVPGYAVLRIVRLHGLGAASAMLYAAGLSMAIQMFLGLVINALLPVYGITRPISLVPLTAAENVVVFGLCAFAYARDRRFNGTFSLDMSEVLVPQVLLPVLLPVIAIVGSLVANDFHSNLVLMFLIVLVAVVMALAGFGRFFPENLYPLVIFTLGISLILHFSLVSDYFLGSDIHEEYQMANLVVINGRWDSGNPSVYNAVLSVTMLGPIAAVLGSFDINTAFKVLYPLLLGLSPLGAYLIFQKQTNPRVALLSCFFFISFGEFFFGLPAIPRQIIAEIFMMLLVLALVDRDLSNTVRAVLMVIFGASMAVSHYGLSYIFVFCLLVALVALALSRTSQVMKLQKWASSRIGGRGNQPGTTVSSVGKGQAVLTGGFFIFFVVATFAWYMYMSGATAFNTYVRAGDHVIRNVISEFLNPERSHGLTLLMLGRKSGLIFWFNYITNYLNQLLIIIGIVAVLVRYRSGVFSFEKSYVALSVAGLLAMIASIFVPMLSLSINIFRLYVTMLIFLAPFFVVGVMTVTTWIAGRLRRSRDSLVLRAVPGALSIYLVLYLFFQSGFAAQVMGQDWVSIPLSRDEIRQNASPDIKVWLDGIITGDQDIAGAIWLADNRTPGYNVFAMRNDIRVHPLSSYGMLPLEQLRVITRRTQEIPRDAYVYLGRLNVVDQIGTEFDASRVLGGERTIFPVSQVSRLFQPRNKVYTNGGSEVFR